MATFQFSDSITINRPAEAVFHYVADVTKASEWRPNVTVRDFSGEPLAVGSTWRDVTKFMGREVGVDFQVTALEPGRQLAMTMEGGVVSGISTWTFDQGTDGSSTARLSFDGELSGWMASLASGLLRNQVQKNMKRDLANLKSNLEPE